MPRRPDDREAYRCSVAPENAAAHIKVGRKSELVAILETSRDGYTIRMDNSVAKQLKDGRSYVLCVGSERWEVRKESHYSDGVDFTNVGFARIRELTKIKSPITWFPFFKNEGHSQSDPAFLIYLMLAFLFACIALPGMGDSLGTAPKIRNGIHMVLDIVKDLF